MITKFQNFFYIQTDGKHEAKNFVSREETAILDFEVFVFYTFQDDGLLKNNEKGLNAVQQNCLS
jgi:hypothetical protein